MPALARSSQTRRLTVTRVRSTATRVRAGSSAHVTIPCRVVPAERCTDCRQKRMDRARPMMSMTLALWCSNSARDSRPRLQQVRQLLELLDRVDDPRPHAVLVRSDAARRPSQQVGPLAAGRADAAHRHAPVLSIVGPVGEHASRPGMPGCARRRGSGRRRRRAATESGSAQRSSVTSTMPAVPGRERQRGQLDVVLAEHAADFAVDVPQRRHALDGVELERGDGTVGILLDRDEVEDPDLGASPRAPPTPAPGSPGRPDPAPRR